MTTALDELLGSGPHAIDGGLASELEARGADLGGDLWSARVLREDPDVVRDVHAAYFRAGAAVGISASYQASRAGIVRAGGSAQEADRLLALSVRLVREAADQVLAEGVGTPRLVAASVGPFGATRHDGSEYRGGYGLSHEELVAFHRERLDVLVAAGPDLIAIETIPDILEAQALVEVLADHPDLPAWLSYSCTDGVSTCAGQPFAEAVAVAVSAPTVRAVGVNCTAPEYVGALLAAGASARGVHPYVVYPNAGRVWDGVASRWLGAGSDLLAPAAVREWVGLGAALVGGCCGLGPAAVHDIATTLSP
ncbi:MAG: homocysteine S-methyltransferase [Candidatus Nanopelagicales bacterium]